MADPRACYGLLSSSSYLPLKTASLVSLGLASPESRPRGRQASRRNTVSLPSASAFCGRRPAAPRRTSAASTESPSHRERHGLKPTMPGVVAVAAKPATVYSSAPPPPMLRQPPCTLVSCAFHDAGKSRPPITASRSGGRGRLSPPLRCSATAFPLRARSLPLGWVHDSSMERWRIPLLRRGGRPLGGRQMSTTRQGPLGRLHLIAGRPGRGVRLRAGHQGPSTVSRFKK